MPYEKQSRARCILITHWGLAYFSLCTAAFRENQQGPAGQSGHACGCWWSRDVTAQGTPSKMSSSLCVPVWPSRCLCVLPHWVEAIHRDIQAPNRSFFPCFQGPPLASPRASLSPRRGGEDAWAGWGGDQPTDKTGACHQSWSLITHRTKPPVRGARSRLRPHWGHQTVNFHLPAEIPEL